MVCLTFFDTFDLQLKVSKVTETSEEKQTNKNKNIQNKDTTGPHTTSHLLPVTEWNLLQALWCQSMDLGLLNVVPLQPADQASPREELFGKWESSIDGSISTSAGNSMARGVQGRWGHCANLVCFCLVWVNWYVGFSDYILYFWK